MAVLHTIYPSFVLESQSGFSEKDDAVLTDLAWQCWHTNHNTEATHGLRSGKYYQQPRANMFEMFWHVPEVQKLAKLVDQFARAYLLHGFAYECNHPIKLMAEPFCQGDKSSRGGIMTHSHRGKPLIVTYYPCAQVETVHEQATGNVGLNGELDFYDPSGEGKRWWPCLRKDVHIGSVFRLPVRRGLMVAFEGVLPHAGCAYSGGDRVVIPVLCYPQMPQKNGGKTLEELSHE